MSDQTAASDVITVGRDGISVEKSLVTDEFPVPTVEFILASTRRDRATVRLREYVPDGYSLESIGFHADFESEHWTAYQDNRIEFERALDPGEEVRTIYGIRAKDDDEVGVFLGEPELVSVRPESAEGPDPAAVAEAAEDVVDPARNEALRSMLGGEEPTPGPTDAAADEPVDAEPTDDPPAGAMPGSVVDALAEELREGDVEDANRDLIRAELGLDLSRSTEAQLRHLQTRVEDLLAYSEPVVAFLEDDGPTRIGELETTVAEVAETVEALEGHHEEQDATEAETVEAIETALDALDERFDTLEARFDEVTDRLDDLDDRVEAADESVEDLTQWRSQLGEMFSDDDE